MTGEVPVMMVLTIAGTAVALTVLVLMAASSVLPEFESGRGERERGRWFRRSKPDG